MLISNVDVCISQSPFHRKRSNGEHEKAWKSEFNSRWTNTSGCPKKKNLRWLQHYFLQNQRRRKAKNRGPAGHERKNLRQAQGEIPSARSYSRRTATSETTYLKLHLGFRVCTAPLARFPALRSGRLTNSGPQMQTSGRSAGSVAAEGVRVICRNSKSTPNYLISFETDIGEFIKKMLIIL